MFGSSAARLSKVQSVDELEIVGELGHGSFAQVVHVRLKREAGQRRSSVATGATTAEGALKILSVDKVSQERLTEQVLSERRVLEKIGSHPHVVKLLSAWSTPSHIYFLLDYVKGGDLFDLIRKHKRLDMTQTAHYVRQIAQALDFVHKKSIIYRDLKLENVLVNEVTDTVLLADFGLAKELKGKAATTQTICGTVQYMSPEILQHKPYNAAVDWWALGVCVYVLMIGRYPFSKGEGDLMFDRSANDRFIMYNRIIKGLLDIPDHVPPAVAETIRKLLHADPAQRLCSGAALDKCPWPRDVKRAKTHALRRFTEPDIADVIAAGPSPLSRTPSGLPRPESSSSVASLAGASRDKSASMPKSALTPRSSLQMSASTGSSVTSPPAAPASPEKSSRIPQRSKTPPAGSFSSTSQQDDALFTMLNDMQGRRLEDQRSPLGPMKGASPATPPARSAVEPASDPKIQNLLKFFGVDLDDPPPETTAATAATAAAGALAESHSVPTTPAALVRSRASGLPLSTRRASVDETGRLSTSSSSPMLSPAHKWGPSPMSSPRTSLTFPAFSAVSTPPSTSSILPRNDDAFLSDDDGDGDILSAVMAVCDASIARPVSGIPVRMFSNAGRPGPNGGSSSAA